MTRNEVKEADPSRCPLCGKANDCQLCSDGAYKGSCWCESLEIPTAVLAQVPMHAVNKACVCRICAAPPPET